MTDSTQPQKTFDEHLSWCKGMLIWTYANPLPDPEPTEEINIGVILSPLHVDLRDFMSNGTTRYQRNVRTVDLAGMTLDEMVAHINGVMDWTIELDQEGLTAFREQRHQKMALEAVETARRHARDVARQDQVRRLEEAFHTLYREQQQPEMLTYNEAKAWADANWEEVKRRCHLI
ncbi:MAG: hypothetical protein KJ077_10875 [Anaerolineae bacterium]|nr:hypothetical protein [Anaerolineae bacterium]